ncbi:MAG: hypothetical protein NUW06_00495 [Candidatus Acetothermia bacterium]|jgi:cell division protein FtsX|nr:hypothetical protein [Candidatus Acetothermia bacterium]MDH7504993.1 hypothetical protein [Candidatus Acetothermia bacterium]
MISLLQELLRLLRRKGLGSLLVAWLLLVLFLALLDLFILAGRGLEEVAGGELLVPLTPGLLPSKIDQLYLEIREWEEVAQVRFIFGEEVRAGLVKLSLPDLAGDLFRVQLRDPGEVASVKERLEKLPGVASVISYDRGALEGFFRTLGRLRWPLLALIVVLGLLALIRLRAALRALITSFSGELRLLHLSGVARKTMGRPFVLLAALLGLGGGLLLTLGLYLTHNWGRVHTEALYRSFPGLLEPQTVLALALLSIGFGLLIGLLGGMWSLLTLRRLAP